MATDSPPSTKAPKLVGQTRGSARETSRVAYQRPLSVWRSIRRRETKAGTGISVSTCKRTSPMGSAEVSSQANAVETRRTEANAKRRTILHPIVSRRADPIASRSVLRVERRGVFGVLAVRGVHASRRQRLEA